MTPLTMLELQLADSAFPTGGFAHSAGLEAAWQQGFIRGSAELREFIHASLVQCGHASLPFVIAACQHIKSLSFIDLECDAMLTNHVANRASRAQGRALARVVQSVFGVV